MLLVGHGSVARSTAGRLLQTLGRRVAARTGIHPVAAGAVYGAPPLGDALRALAGRAVIVVPVVMCNGGLVHDAVAKAAALLPSAARPRSFRYGPPVGLLPGVSDLVVTAAAAAACAHGWAPAATSLVLVAHGSPRRPASRRMAETHARRLVGRSRFRRVLTAYLEEPPHVSDVIREVPGPAVVFGLFLGGGRHAEDDLAAAVAGAEPAGAAYAGCVGDQPAVADLIAAAALDTVAMGPVVPA